MPKGFKLTSATPKYDALEEPEGWLDDYLQAVKFQRGSNIIALQYIQLMLIGSARHWLKTCHVDPSVHGDSSDRISLKTSSQLTNGQPH